MSSYEFEVMSLAALKLAQEQDHEEMQLGPCWTWQFPCSGGQEMDIALLSLCWLIPFGEITRFPD